MGLKVSFTPSQLSLPGVTSPVTFRTSPSSLLWRDLMLCASLIFYMPFIIIPFPTTNKNGELYLLNAGNVVSIVVHIALGVCSLFGILAAPFIVLLVPGIASVLFGAGVAASCAVWVFYLNRGPAVVHSTVQLPLQNRFKGEKWFFINGVMVGNHWLMAAVNEMSTIFGREVEGIRNKTWGLFFDLLECLIQRDLGYTTTDIRIAYTNIKAALMDDNLQTVVVFAHSQGGLVLSMALDNLLADLPKEYFSKLEIYTFGCAANHFNNPRHGVGGLKPTIPYVEHYINTYDFVSNWGVLEYVRPVPAGTLNRFSGRLFERADKGGHMFVQHYLTNMFGVGKDDFLSQIMDDESGNRSASRPDITESAKDILAKPTGKKSVKEMSRLAGYLGGNIPASLANE